MSRGLTIICIFLVAHAKLPAQQRDSLRLAADDMISKRMESLEQESENGADLSEICDGFEELLEEPVNLNAAGKDELRGLQLLTDIQIRNLIDYRRKYGPFLTIYELRAIEGFNRITLEKIMPFTVLGAANSSSGFARPTNARHDLLMRLQRKIINPSGYDIPADSAQMAKTGSYYLGNPYRYYIRYRLTSGKHFRAGITAEKDPGEMFLKMPEWLDKNLAEGISRPIGFDFYSGHFEIKDLLIFRSIVVGDYHIRCGQGLVLWSGLSHAGGNDASAFKRYTSVIRPNTSASENNFFRGLATTIEWNSISLSLFYSRIKTDARTEAGEDGKPVVTSMPGTGYHRTPDELNLRNRMLLIHSGGHLSFSSRRLRLGLTAYSTKLNPGIRPYDDAARQKNFSGERNFNAGLNFEWLMRKTILFGEIACSMNGGYAALAGLTHNTANGSIISLMIREYRDNYQNMMSSAQGRRDGNANERGFKLAMEVPLLRVFLMDLFTEHYSYLSLIPNNNNVVRGQKHELSMVWKVNRGITFSGRYRYDRSVSNENSKLYWFDRMEYSQRQRIRFLANYLISDAFSIKGMLEYGSSRKNAQGKPEKGSLLALDFFFRSLSDKVRITFRYALFNTGGYDSRLYAYEHDVLYASSMPAYYGKGFRTYVLFRYAPARWFDTWIRLSLTNYTDRSVISSGTEEINGNKLPEIKVQCRIKL
ncbi:MAG TPA: helix-hairpin-helix domain-containing protein [Bacteroidales bacterium]|nr:helix-hairpin-helix domain-containing protein [Bacteroidales bacterium]